MPIVRLENEDGTENEVEVPASAIEIGEDEELTNEELPDGLVTQDTINEAISNRLPRAYKQTLESVGLDPQEYTDEDGNVDLDGLDPDTLFKSLATDRGIELREDGRPKGSLKDDEIQDLQERASKYESAKEELEDLRQKDRTRRLNEAWEKVKKNAPPIRDGAEEMLRRQFEDSVTIEDDTVVPVDENGNIRRNEVHAPEDITTLSDELPTAHSFAFESTKMEGGPDDDPGSGSSGGRTYTREEWESKMEDAAELSEDEYNELRSALKEGRVT